MTDKCPVEGFQYFRREFLNRPGKEAMAAIEVSVPQADFDWPAFKMSDCRKTIELALAFDNPLEIDLSIEKVQLIANCVNGLLKAMKKEGAKRKRPYVKKKGKYVKKKGTV